MKKISYYLEWPWNKSKLCNTQEFIRNVGIWPVEIFFLKDLLCWLSFHLTVSRVCLRATSCSSEVSPVVFKHQLLAQNFSIWCWIFINFNIHIVLFCWYQPFHGMSLQCNTLGKIARNKTSQFTLIQILSFINDQYLSEPTTHLNQEPQVCMQLPSGKRRRWQGKHLQKKKKKNPTDCVAYSPFTNCLDWKTDLQVCGMLPSGVLVPWSFRLGICCSAP